MPSETNSKVNSGPKRHDGSDNSTRAKATAEIYDPTTATFTTRGSMNAVRVWHTSTVLQNGKVLITGGAAGSSSPMATAEVYQ